LVHQVQNSKRVGTTRGDFDQSHRERGGSERRESVEEAKDDQLKDQTTERFITCKYVEHTF
jgi:hypothetical protein